MNKIDKAFEEADFISGVKERIQSHANEEERLLMSCIKRFTQQNEIMDISLIDGLSDKANVPKEIMDVYNEIANVENHFLQAIRHNMMIPSLQEIVA